MPKNMVPYIANETPDLVAEQIDNLERIFPECVSEGKVDFALLEATLGNFDALAGEDAYRFTWAGKADSFRSVQAPSSATLRPDFDRSINFEGAQHVYIKGENLEVLKLLYKSYYGKAKLIYIDPPYNTGNDFIYRDNYIEPKRAYLEKTGQIDADGNLLTSNPDSRGRYHSAWLSMMSPRLFLARQLLQEDGVLMVSLDDNEFHHGRLLLNEIFGEENFVATVIWHKVFAPKNTAMYFSEDHDYILCYAKNKSVWRPNLLPRTEEADARYTNPDEDPRGPWSSSDLTARNYYSEGRYEVESPNGTLYRPTVGTYWRVSKSNFKELEKDGRIWWGESGSNMPRLKRFLSEVKQGIVPQTIWHFSDVGHTQEAKKELLENVHFEITENVLNTVKPTRLIRRMINLATDPHSKDVVLDFFAGSAATTQAVIEQNLDDGGNRRSITIQFPEPLPIPEDNLETIADIGEARIRSVIERIQNGKDNNIDDALVKTLGVRILHLSPSTFQTWEMKEGITDEKNLEQMALFEGGIDDEASSIDVAYEVALKEGYSLFLSIEQLALKNGQRVLKVSDEPEEEGSLSDRLFYLCLDDSLHPDLADELKLNEEVLFVCLDSALTDSLKMNLALQCRLKVI